MDIRIECVQCGKGFSLEMIEEDYCSECGGMLMLVNNKLYFKDVDTFIQKHDHIYYCEAVINKDGEICYVRPSHVETLLKITGESRKEIYDKMTIADAPINWLTDYTGCIPVWYKGYITPKSGMTEKQRITIEKLKKHGVISKDALGF